VNTSPVLAWCFSSIVCTSGVCFIRLVAWLLLICPDLVHGLRILPVTLPVAAAWGRQQYAQPLPVIDALIARQQRGYTT
jgi:hypothetical protein